MFFETLFVIVLKLPSTHELQRIPTRIGGTNNVRSVKARTICNGARLSDKNLLAAPAYRTCRAF